MDETATDIDIDSPACRRGLFVKPSRGGVGLFTRERIARGDVVGFYTGEPWRAADVEHMPDKAERIAYMLRLPRKGAVPEVILCPRLRTNGRGVDPRVDPLACANELTDGPANMVTILCERLDASAFALSWDACDRLEDRRSFRCVAFVACSHVRAGDELVWNYGAGVVRDCRVHEGDEPDLGKAHTTVDAVCRKWGGPFPASAMDSPLWPRPPPSPPSVATEPSVGARARGSDRRGVCELLLTCNLRGRAPGIFSRIQTAVDARYLCTDATASALPRWLRAGFVFVDCSRPDAAMSATTTRTVDDVLRHIHDERLRRYALEGLAFDERCRFLGLVCRVARHARPTLQWTQLRGACDPALCRFRPLFALDVVHVLALARVAYFCPPEHPHKTAPIVIDLMGVPCRPGPDVHVVDKVRVRRNKLVVDVADGGTFSLGHDDIVAHCGAEFSRFGTGTGNYRTQMVRKLNAARRKWLVWERDARRLGFAFIVELNDPSEATGCRFC